MSGPVRHVNLFVGNIPFDATRDDFGKLVRPVGQAISVYVPEFTLTDQAVDYRHKAGWRKGFAYIELILHEGVSLEHALRTLDGVVMGNRILRVEESNRGKLRRMGTAA